MEADFSGCYVVYICLERTNSTFQGSQNHHDAVVDSVLSKVALWAMRCKEFHGYMWIPSWGIGMPCCNLLAVVFARSGASCTNLVCCDVFLFFSFQIKSLPFQKIKIK